MKKWNMIHKIKSLYDDGNGHKGDGAVEKWIAEKSVTILNGQCSQVAKGIRLSTTKRKIIDRGNMDKCADYLLKNKERWHYGEALSSGFPIASGVIEVHATSSLMTGLILRALAGVCRVRRLY